MSDFSYLRTPRTYFDPFCHESTSMSAEKKLLDLGRAIMNGYDIHNEVRNILANHSHISEDDIHYAVCEHIANVCGGEILAFDLLEHNNSLDTDIDLLILYLMRRYRVAYRPDNGHYLANHSLEIDRRELESINGWTVAAQRVNYLRMYDFGNFVAYPGDAELIRNYNLRASGRNKGFISYICPEPWYGNPSGAKVIILGDAPRYDDYASRISNALLEHWPQLAEEVAAGVVHDWWELSPSSSFYETRPIDSVEPQINLFDLYNSPTYRHWLDQFRRWASWFNVDEQTLFGNVAVINATAYLSIGDTPLATGLLPSHYFLLHLVKYIAMNNSETIFVVPSEELHRVWAKILGSSYDEIAAKQKVIWLNGNHRKLNLSLRNLNKEQQSTIRERLTAQ